MGNYIHFYYFRCYINILCNYCTISIIMPALFEKINVRDDESFFIGIFQDNLEKSAWHYHNTFEISFMTDLIEQARARAISEIAVRA